MKSFLGFFMMLFFLTGCGVYSFSGASIPDGAKTITIAIFENTAKLVVPNLSQKVTEALKNQVLNGTPLSQVNDPAQADLVFEGQITDYTVQPVAITGGGVGTTPSVSQSTRLTITVNVKYIDKKHEKNNFDQSFSRYADFPGTTNLSTVEQSLIDQINKQLIQDIYNRAFVNW